MRRWTLRRQLVVAVALLLILAAAAITIVTTVAMRQVLMSQVDQSLQAAKARGIDPPGGRYGDRHVLPGLREEYGGAPRCLGAVGQAPGTLCGVLAGTGSDPSLAYLDTSDQPQLLTTPQQVAIARLERDGRPHTVDIPDLGRYRVVVDSSADGDYQVAGVPLSALDAAVTTTALRAAAVTVLAVVLSTVIGGAIVSWALRPLQRVAATARRVSTLQLATGEVVLPQRVADADTDERTEVGRVGAALNRLLGHVEAALAARHESETQVRQFVADASHELRTPLAAIRGYAELARRTREPVPADVAHALGRVESESVRMTGLVTDLLLLASLDSGRPLDREPVDISALVVDAVGDAHVAGPDHSWRLDVPEEPLVVVGDGARLHQVVGNLLANAWVHTPPGTVVTTRLAADAVGNVVIEVADDGPGIPTALTHSIFQRFARGDSSRSRAAGSTGLGLAIATAVVEAHGGTITVVSVPAPAAGHGARFTVSLPSVAPTGLTTQTTQTAMPQAAVGADVPPGAAVTVTAQRQHTVA